MAPRDLERKLDASNRQLAGHWRFDIVNRAALGLSGGANPPNYNAGGVPNNNQGNSRNANGNLIYNYNPIVVSGSVTYTLDSFPLYNGKFPIKLAGEYMDNPGADPAKGPANNQGYWGGITFGKSGKKGTWDISYRYQYLEADAWYDELVDDDNVAFYSNKSIGPGEKRLGRRHQHQRPSDQVQLFVDRCPDLLVHRLHQRPDQPQPEHRRSG